MSDEQTKRGHGCFFYGCITVIILFLVASLALYFGARYALKQVLARYTDTTPLALAQVNLPTVELKALQARVEAFQKAVQAGAAAAPLVLSETEINALISHDPSFSGLKNRVNVALEGDQVKGQVSIPLENLGWSLFRGRYLNGTAAFKVSLSNGVLIVTLQSLRVKGEDLPAQFLAQLQKQNLAKNLYDDPKSAEVMRNLESVEVKDGQVTLKARATK